MTEPPTDVLSDRLRDAVAGRTVKGAVFTTFTFEPAFFEQEILTALFDVAWHHVPRLRLLQLEEILRPLSGRLAVYYDQRALVEGDLGSPGLDVRRIPCWSGTGYFHPKLVLAVVEDGDVRSVVMVVSSANLTRAGWWENVEAVRVEELTTGSSSRMRDALEAFLRHLRSRTRAVDQHEALTEVLDCVRSTYQLSQRTRGGHLHPHFHWNGRRGAMPLAEFIAEQTRGMVRGWKLEVISPYVDDRDTSQPLNTLVARLGVSDVRVALAEEPAGAVCRESLFRDVVSRGWTWGRLPAALLSRGSGPTATERRFHAKVYRFYAGREEVLFVGSANLTSAGHDPTGNIEAGVLFHRQLQRTAQPWLTPIEEPPTFAAPVTEDESASSYVHPLILRYNWSTSTRELAVLWQLDAPNPAMAVTARGIELFTIAAGRLPSRTWLPLIEVDPDTIEAHLKSSSFLTATDDLGRETTLLVLEIGMAYRPSLLLDLTPAEILQYWSLLSSAQRAEWLAERGEELGVVEGGEALVPAREAHDPHETMFDRFAGMFHGFAVLERTVREMLEQQDERQAEFLICGQKPDSLRRLVDRIAERRDGDDPVDSYLLLLCAEQLVHELKRDWPVFWARYAAPSGLDLALAARREIGKALIEANGGDMGRFLDWYDRRFLRRAKELRQ